MTAKPVPEQISDELLPCPFCGGALVITKHFKMDVYSAVHRCKIVGSMSFDFQDRARVVSSWNTRALAAGLAPDQSAMKAAALAFYGEHGITAMSGTIPPQFERAIIAYVAASPSSAASGVRVKASLSAMIDWVQAALDCNDWYWSSDQREAAELELATARSALSEWRKGRDTGRWLTPAGRAALKDTTHAE